MRKNSSNLPHSWLFSLPFSYCLFFFFFFFFFCFWSNDRSKSKTKLMSTSIILLLLLLLFNNAFFFRVHASLSTAAQFELIHRHAPQLSGRGRTLGPPENRLEGVKQLIHSDDARQQMISHRRGLRRRRMMGWEAHSRGDLMKIPMRSAADMGTGQYFVSFRVGSPRPQKVVLIADTGSDLTWMHCNYRCHDCWKKSFLGRAERIFHADLSPSFKTIPCLSNMCKVDLADTFSLSRCPEPMTPCAYDYKYADGSTITGFFANETVTVGLGNSQKIRLHDVVIGCSESWVETSFRELDGIMGLGYGKHSFAVKAAEKFANKFSYCLVDHLSPSNLVNYLSFGNTTSSLLPNMQYTELVLGVISPFYAVNVVGISIGGVMLKIPLQVWDVNGDGGAILDSGSSLTFLTEPAYKPLMATFEAPLMKFKRIELDLGPMEFCFSATGFEESLAPKLAFHFADGAQFAPPVKSYIIDVADGVKCLGFVSADWPGTSVIGNIMQQNHVWEFDLGRNKLGFAPSTCS